MRLARPPLGAARPPRPRLVSVPRPRQAGADLRPRREQVGRGDWRGEVEVGGRGRVQGAEGEGEGTAVSELVRVGVTASYQ